MKIKKGLLIEKLGKKYVAYDNNTSTLHELNETAFLILQELKKGKTKRDIIKKLISEYKISGNQAKTDLEGFVSELNNKDLIEGQ